MLKIKVHQDDALKAIIRTSQKHPIRAGRLERPMWRYHAGAW